MVHASQIQIYRSLLRTSNAASSLASTWLLVPSLSAGKTSRSCTAASEDILAGLVLTAPAPAVDVKYRRGVFPSSRKTLPAQSEDKEEENRHEKKNVCR